MRHTTAFTLLTLFILTLTCPATAELVLITEEFPPFNYTREGMLTGATTQVVREIARRLGISDKIEVMPWARGYKRLLNEPDVVLFTTARTTARDPLFHWVGPLYQTRLGFYALKKRGLRIDSLEAAREAGTIATYRDDYGEQILKSLGFTKIDSSNDPKSNVRKLISERADLWLFNNIGAPTVAIAAGVDPHEIEEVFTYQRNFSYIAISKPTSISVVRQWQAALDAMKADGTFFWLSHKWLPTDAILISVSGSNDVKPVLLKLYTENSPPSSFPEEGQVKGLSVDIVKEILRRTAQPDTIRLVPWARGYKLALADKNTAIFSTTRLSQREDLFAWVGPLYRQRWGFYRWKDSAVEVAGMAAARKIGRIGTYHKDAKMQYLKAQGFQNLVPTNKNVTNLMHLQRGHIDLWVSSDFNMPHLANQAGFSPAQFELAYAFNTVGNYIAFSKKTSPDVIRLWQAVLDEMKSDGTYQQICRKHDYFPK